MASGNDKELKIGITAETAGADEAKRALEGVKQAAAGLEKQAEETEVAMEKLAGAAGGTGAAGSRSGRVSAAQGMKSLADESKKAGEANSDFGRNAAQIGYQVQDMAVQFASGADALTVFAQQGSQLLSIFGPGGALAGTILALGAAAAKFFMTWEEEGQAAAEGSQDYIESLERIRQKAADLIIAKDELASSRFKDSLDEEAESYRRLNEEAETNIRLANARRDAQNMEADAQDAIELAEIDADPNLSEAEKIKRRGVIKERGYDRQTQDRLSDVDDRVKQKEADFQTKQAEVAAKTEVAAKAAQKAQDAVDERNRLKPKVDARREIPSAEAEVEEVQRVLEGAKAALNAPDYSETGMSVSLARELAEEVRKSEAALEEANKRLEEVRGRAGNERDVARYEALNGNKKRPGIIDDREKEADERYEELQESREEAEKAKRALIEETDVAGYRKGAIVGSANKMRQARWIRNDAQIRNVDEREKDKDARDKAQEEKRVQGIGDRGEDLADRAASIAESKNLGAAAKAFEKLGDEARKNPTAAVLSELADAIGRFNDNFGKQDAKMSRELGQIRGEVQRLNGQMNRGGDGRSR